MSDNEMMKIFENPEYGKYHKIDFDKIKTVEDIVMLIDAIFPMGIQVAEGYSNIDKIKHLLKESDNEH